MKLTNLVSIIAAASIFIGCSSKMDLKIKSEPTNADVYLEKDGKKQKFIGSTDFKKPYRFKFKNESDFHSIVLKKYGYQDKKVFINYAKEYNSDLIVTLEKNKKKKMAFATPTIENDEVVFSLVYDWGYFNTIENSPNALNVERVVVADGPDELIGKFDVKQGKLVFERSFPEKGINKEDYVEKLDLLSELIESYKNIKDEKSAQIFMPKFNIKAKLYREILQEDYMMVLTHFKMMADDGETKYINNEIPKALELRLAQIKTIPLKEMYSELWLANVGQGFGKTRLTNTNKRWLDQSPSISSDGNIVYFSSNRNGNTFNIWRLSTDGGMGITKITTSSWSNDFMPSVDSENELIAYHSFPRGEQKPQIWTIKSNGSLPSQLREGKNVNMCSNGENIVFARNSSDNKKQLWLMKSNGAAETMFTVNTNFNENYASFSPDCKWVAYQSDESGNQDIYVMKIDGSSKIQLTTNHSVDSMPIWADDGYIYFKSNRGLVWGIWRLKALIQDDSNS